MSEWHCRRAAGPVPREMCAGPLHDTCGLRYAPGEFTLTRSGITLPGIGMVPIDNAAFAPRDAAAIIFRDGDGWVAEFEASRGTVSPVAGTREDGERDH